MKVLALIPYPINLGPSQRFRLGIFISDLNKRGVNIDSEPFYLEEDYANLYVKRAIWTKFLIIFNGFLRRTKLLFSLSKYELIYVQREITPIGPPIFAWIIKKIFKKKLVYDFDDAIWLPNYSDNNAFFHRLKFYKKTKYFIKWSDSVIAGNQFLANYSLQWNKNTFVLPTVVDTVKIHNPSLYKSGENEMPVIGWTGSLSTLHHLDIIFPILDELHKLYEFRFLVISNHPPKEEKEYLVFKKWKENSEIEDLMEIDLGIMPLKEDFKFAEGKCGFKLIQFMSLGKLVLASPLGVNKEIVEHGVSGFLCTSEDEWRSFMSQFLKGELTKTGEPARVKIHKHYSLDAIFENFLRILKRK